MSAKNGRRYRYAARTIDEAIDTLEDEPLIGERLAQFYVDRPGHYDRDRLLAALQRAILRQMRGEEQSGRRAKFLVMGLRGCGKSTDLNWLSAAIVADPELESRVVLVRYDVNDFMETKELDFVEVAISLVVALYEEMERLDIVLDENPLWQICAWTRGMDVTEVKERERKPGVGISVLGLLKLDWSGKGAERYERRYKVRWHLPELIELVNQQIKAIEETTGCYVIFIVDQLDKVSPPEVALDLFYANREYLADLHCFAVYSAPISLALHPSMEAIRDLIEMRYIVPMFQVHDREWNIGPVEEKDVAILRDIVYKRAVPALFDVGVVDAAIQVTGGIVRHLLQLLQACCTGR